MSQPRERRPTGTAWTEVRAPEALRLEPMVIAVSAWRWNKVTVISCLERAELLDQSGVGPQWHVSIARGLNRARPDEVQRALRAFGMVGAEEDNHHPGSARHFWLPLDPAHRVDCECKETETVVVDPKDGYTWTNPTDGPCRGCEAARVLGKPCPLHPALTVSPSSTRTVPSSG